ncbi:MAG: hypothetical protein COY40_05975 [Alphaproteobacteria bacterium CG_4_10_14_0_8_um_filter_53_9]|nr:MAG: hypothetical protein COY40_05975 [Alphaproteobacteria bacterium CG_4_10_14_0_8_um_filter_53_9]
MYACNYNDNPAAEARRDAVAARRRAKGPFGPFKTEMRALEERIRQHNRQATGAQADYASCVLNILDRTVQAVTNENEKSFRPKVSRLMRHAEEILTRHPGVHETEDHRHVLTLACFHVQGDIMPEEIMEPLPLVLVAPKVEQPATAA